MLENSAVRMRANAFTVNGTIQVASGQVDEVFEVAASSFDGVHLVFNDMSLSKLILRNNQGSDYYTMERGSPQQCDATQTGQAAGCDRRAECIKSKPGGVNCTCRTPLSFKPGTNNDGSTCVINGQLLGISQVTRTIQAHVRKPINFSVTFFVEAQSEATFNATVTTNAPFVVINGKQSFQQEYALSPAKPQRTNMFELTVLGSKTRWADTEDAKIALVKVEAPQGRAAEAGAQTLKVHTTLAPYGSCKHTSVSIEGLQQAPIDHTKADIRLDVVAKDSDGFLISNTPFNTPLNTRIVPLLVYHSGSKLAEPVSLASSVVQDSKNKSRYTLVILGAVLYCAPVQYCA